MSIRHTSLFSHKGDATGFTLVELMIALALGLILIGGVIQLLMSSRQAYQVNDALARVQETGRIALEIMSRDLRLSGYSGCQRSSNLSIQNPSGNALITAILAGPAAQGSLRGYDNGAVPTGSPAPNAGTDSLFISGMSGASTNIDPRIAAPGSTSTQIASQTANLPYSVGGGWAAGDILLVADCYILNNNADAFIAPANANTANGGIIPSPGKLATRYATDAVIGPIFFANYLIRNDVDGVPSLFRDDLTDNQAPIVLVQGVEDMQFRFAVDTNNDGTPDVYQDTNVVTAANWNNVYAIEISLLIRDPNPVGNLTTNTQTYRFPSWAAADTNAPTRHMRAVVSTTVALRNRIQ